MRGRISKALLGLAAAALLLSPISAHADSYVRLKGKLVDGRTYVPLRAAGEQMKAQIGWNNKTKTATITKDGKKLTATVGIEARLFDGSVYVQFRQINDAFYASEQIIWTPYKLMANTNHVIVSTAPLSNDEAMNLLHNAVIQSNSLAGVEQKRTFLRQYFTDKAINKILAQGGVNVLQPITPDKPAYITQVYYYNLTSFNVSESMEHYDGDHSFRAILNATIVRQESRWLVDTIDYETNSISPPNN